MLFCCSLKMKDEEFEEEWEEKKEKEQNDEDGVFLANTVTLSREACGGAIALVDNIIGWLQIQETTTVVDTDGYFPNTTDNLLLATTLATTSPNPKHLNRVRESTNH